MRFTRAGGVLVHPTSFPGRYGIGDLGDAAYGFVDFLEQYGRGLWQVLPLGPVMATHRTRFFSFCRQSTAAQPGSPSFAMVVYPPRRLLMFPDLPHDRVDFGPLITYKMRCSIRHCTTIACTVRLNSSRLMPHSCAENAAWVDDYALLMALEDASGHEGGVWNTWPQNWLIATPSRQQWHDTHA